MPEMDGKKLIENVRRIESEKMLKRKMITILTGNMKEEEMLKNTGLFGADYLMIKPFKIKRFTKYFDNYMYKINTLSNEKGLNRKESNTKKHISKKKILIVDDDTFSSGISPY